MPKVALIVNPRATGVDDGRIEQVRATIARAADVDVYVTRHRGHASTIAGDVARAVDALFVYSGDGGFNEVVNGLPSGAPPLACIPGGGTSVFPRGLGLPRDPVRAADRLTDAFQAGRVRRISVGRVNGRRFLFSAGVRLDAELVRRIEARRSRSGRPGDVAFVATLLKLVAEHRARFEPIIDVDGLGRASFVLVANADPYTYLGALPVHVAPDASLERGLDVFAAPPTNVRRIVRLLAFVLSGRGRPRNVRTLHDVDRVVLHCDVPLPLQADGEDLGDVSDAVFEAERGAIGVVVPT